MLKENGTKAAPWTPCATALARREAWHGLGWRSRTWRRGAIPNKMLHWNATTVHNHNGLDHFLTDDKVGYHQFVFDVQPGCLMPPNRPNMLDVEMPGGWRRNARGWRRNARGRRRNARGRRRNATWFCFLSNHKIFEAFQDTIPKLPNIVFCGRTTSP